MPSFETRVKANHNTGPVIYKVKRGVIWMVAGRGGPCSYGTL